VLPAVDGASGGAVALRLIDHGIGFARALRNRTGGSHAARNLGIRHTTGTGCDRRGAHCIGHLARLSEQRAEPEARKDERVVALCNRVRAAAVFDRLERTAGRDDGAPFGPADQVLRPRLGIGGRIRQREDHRARCIRRNPLDQLLRKAPPCPDAPINTVG
jgi:hypothetical protein